MLFTIKIMCCLKVIANEITGSSRQYRAAFAIDELQKLQIGKINRYTFFFTHEQLMFSVSQRIRKATFYGFPLFI